MMKRLFTVSMFLFSGLALFAQVGIGTNTPDSSAQLDITATNKGMLVPRVTLTGTADITTVPSPATGLLVYNTATANSGSSAVVPGFYYWSGSWQKIISSVSGWQPTGNYLSTTGVLGSLSNNHIDLVTNNTTRGRITNTGNFYWGSTTGVYNNSLFQVSSNSAYTNAISGFSAYGSAIYGEITTGSTASTGAVQGIFNSSNNGPGTSGVSGSNNSTIAGIGFQYGGQKAGVLGRTSQSTGGSYNFGVFGTFSSVSTRCGAVLGDDFGLAFGGLGYYSSTAVDYGVYGFGKAYQTGTSGGRASVLTEENTQIGLGAYGGVMGGWMRGLVYGTHIRGDRYSLYVDGKTYTNAPVTELVNTGAETRTPVYALTSLTTDIYAKGKALLQNGELRIEFDPAFLQLASENPEDMIITVTPASRSKGVYISKQDAKGFVITENENSGQAITVNYIVMATRRNNETIIHSPEILRKDFDSKMDGVMFNENNTKDQPGYLWWDGKDIRFDKPPERRTSNN